LFCFDFANIDFAMFVCFGAFVNKISSSANIFSFFCACSRFFCRNSPDCLLPLFLAGEQYVTKLQVLRVQISIAWNIALLFCVLTWLLYLSFLQDQDLG
jgi:hypothetical protein